MTEQNKMRIITFYYYYLIVLSSFTAVFFWFEASQLLSWLRLVLLLGIPVLILWRSRERQEEEEKKGKKLPMCQFGALLFPGIIGAPASLLYERQDNFWLCCLFLAAAIGLFFAGEYIRGRYLLLYCNPSVSEETRRRTRKNMKKYLVEMAVIGVVVLLLLLVLSSFEPEFSQQERRKTNTVQQETDHDPNPVGKRQKEQGSKRQEEQEQKEQNVFLLALRYVLLVAIVVMGVTAVCYGLFRFLFYLIRGRRKPVWQFEETLTEKREDEEYTRLVPVARSEVRFPGGFDGKIRRQFYKEVRRQAGDHEIIRSKTPVELKETYLEPNEREAVLTELYEKARYARESVTEEEIRSWEKM